MQNMQNLRNFSAVFAQKNKQLFGPILVYIVSKVDRCQNTVWEQGG